MSQTPGKRLEQYTMAHPEEVLLVKARVAGEEDEITVFKGFSSSLMQPTAYDPDIPVLPEHSEILAIDRLVSPYNPTNPQVIQQGLNWTDFLPLLEAEGL